MSWLNDGYHPIWSCVRLALLLALMFVVMYSTASNFDETELKAIGLIAFGMATGEVLIPHFRKGTKG